MSALIATMIFLLPLLVVLLLIGIVVWREMRYHASTKPYMWETNEAIARAQAVDECRRRRAQEHARDVAAV